jgi:Zn-finger protein
VSYSSWVKKHGLKHKEIMERLKDLSDDEVIEYFRFENMVEKEPNFCPLYAKNKKCHDIENLNCYLCACPNFRFNDSGFEKIEDKTLFSYCSIDSKNGKKAISKSAIHQDCSDCLIPHREDFIKKVFNRDWFEIFN